MVVVRWRSWIGVRVERARNSVIWVVEFGWWCSCVCRSICGIVIFVMVLASFYKEFHLIYYNNNTIIILIWVRSTFYMLD